MILNCVIKKQNWVLKWRILREGLTLRGWTANIKANLRKPSGEWACVQVWVWVPVGVATYVRECEGRGHRSWCVCVCVCVCDWGKNIDTVGVKWVQRCHLCRALYTVVSSLFLMFVQRPPLEDILFTHFWIWVIIGRSAHDKLRTWGPESLNDFFRVLRRVRGRVKSGPLAQVRCSVYSTNQHCRWIASVAEFLLRTV